MTEPFKPFSIYDDDEEKKGPILPPDIHEQEGELNLEIEDDSSSVDLDTRRDMMKQLEIGGRTASDVSKPDGESRPESETLKKTPFLQGQADKNMEDRAKDLIRKRKETGKIRDRRVTASIFDKPVEGDKPIRQGKTAWHPLSYRAQAFWFLFPALVFFGLFYLYPLVQGLLISLNHYSPLGKSFPVGLDNYNRAFQDPLFRQTAVNAASFTLISLLLGFWPPILLAILLNEIPAWKGLFKFLYLVPFIIPAIPAANLWKWMYSEGSGVFNSILRELFHSPDIQVGWLSDPRWVLISIIIMFVWKNLGWYMLIYFTYLQSLPEELYDAAELDGAGIFHKVFNITLPHLRPVMGILLIIQVLTTFQVFTEVYVMTNGGPMHTSEVLGTYIYKTAFGAMDLGYASAMAMLMFAALFVFSMIRLWQLKREVR